MSIFIFIALSFFISLVSMPIIIKFCQKKNLYDYHDERKIHTGDKPRLGGIGIILGFVVSSLIYVFMYDVLEVGATLPIIVAGAIIFIAAFVDDILNLPAIVKLLIQLIAVSVVTFNGYRFTQICGWQIPTILSFILTFGWVLGVINAYNLIDGLDGLCGSLSTTTVATLGVLYVLSGNAESGLCFILAGAIFGFLCFNWPPSKLFMGDGGSQFLGFMIATIPLFSSGEVFEYNKFLVMLVLTAFPVFDTIAAIWRRLRDKRPIMSADHSHLHHKLLNLGYTQKHALYLVVVLQVLLCGTVVISFFLGTKKGAALLMESIVFMTLFFSVIHYTNKSVNDKKLEAEEAAQAEEKKE